MMRVVLLRALPMQQIWPTIGNIFRNNLRNFGNLSKITGEHDENTLGTRKRSPPRKSFPPTVEGHGPNQRSSSSHPLVSLPWADSTLIIEFQNFWIFIYLFILREKKIKGKNTGSSAGIFFICENENFQKIYLLLLLFWQTCVFVVSVPRYYYCIG
jgi:hypothetical protein